MKNKQVMNKLIYKIDTIKHLKTKNFTIFSRRFEDGACIDVRKTFRFSLYKRKTDYPSIDQNVFIKNITNKKKRFSQFEMDVIGDLKSLKIDDFSVYFHHTIMIRMIEDK